MATSFLVIAPNVIVFERLKADFGDGATFRRDPLDPAGVAGRLRPHRAAAGRSSAGDDPRVRCTSPTSSASTSRRRGGEETPRQPRRGDGRPASERATPRRAPPRSCSTGSPSRGRVMVVNDEAHHVWDEKLKWNQSIERLHAELQRALLRRSRAPASSPSSTSRRRRRTRRGSIFRHVVVDYPLAQAVADGIVKTPIIGEVSGARSSSATPSVQRDRQWLDVAVGRWRKFDEALSPVGQAARAVRHVREHAGGRRGRRLPAPAPGVRGRPAAGHPHQPLRRDHQGRPRPRAHGRARGRRPGQPDPLHRQRADAARGLGRSQRLRDRHPALADARRRRSCPSRRSAAACGG